MLGAVSLPAASWWLIVVLSVMLDFFICTAAFPRSANSGSESLRPEMRDMLLSEACMLADLQLHSTTSRMSRESLVAKQGPFNSKDEIGGVTSAGFNSPKGRRRRPRDREKVFNSDWGS